MRFNFLCNSIKNLKMNKKIENIDKKLYGRTKDRGRLVEAVKGRNMVVKGSSKRSLPKES